MGVLENKTALITGASGGIGSAAALMLAKLGADIYVHYNHSIDKARETAERVSEYGSSVYLLQCDLTSAEDVRRLYDDIAKKSGSIDILVNNAGIWKTGYVKSFKEQDWDSVINTNMKSVYLCTKYAIRFLARSPDARIVNITSISAHNASVAQLAYNASKAALISMTKTMAKEFGALGIKVNAVSPGPIRTAMRTIDEDEEERLKKIIPLKRIANVDDVANAIAFFCSPASEYITGQVLCVDGGLSV